MVVALKKLTKLEKNISHFPVDIELIARIFLFPNSYVKYHFTFWNFEIVSIYKFFFIKKNF